MIFRLPVTKDGLLKCKTKCKNVISEYWYILIAALIPAVLVFLMYLARGLYPFGNGCVLVLDLNGQYVYFFEALRNFVVNGDTSIIYSFSRALGGEFMGIYAYYIASKPRRRRTARIVGHLARTAYVKYAALGIKAPRKVFSAYAVVGVGRYS